MLRGKAFQTLEKRLRNAVNKGDKETLTLVINATKDTRIKFVAGVLDAAVGAGVTQIAFRGLD